MNKFFITLIFTLTFLIMSNVESMGQSCDCPDSTLYTKTTQVIQYNTNCYVIVEFCYFCSPTTLERSIYICNVIIPWNQGSCNWDGVDIGSQVFWETIYENLILKLPSLSECDDYELCDEFPCDSPFPNKVVEIKKASCFRRILNPILMQTEIIPCQTEATCKIEYCVCWNGTDYTINKTKSSEIGTSNCIKRVIGVGGGFADPPSPNPSPNACFNPCY